MVRCTAWIIFVMSSCVWSVGSQPTQETEEEFLPLPVVVSLAHEEQRSLLQEARSFTQGEGDQDRFFALLEEAKRSGTLALQDEDGMTVAHYAACESEGQLLDAVVKARAPFDQQDNLGRTPLHCLTEHFFSCGSLDLSRRFPRYQKILKAIAQVKSVGVPLAVQDSQGRFPLGINIPESSRESIIHALVRANKIDPLQEIVALGLPVVFQATDGRSTLDEARSVEMVTFLQSQGGDIFERRPNGFTILHMIRSSRVAQFLIDNGLDINDAKNEEKYTPLHAAATSGASGVVRVLLQYAQLPEDITAEIGYSESAAKRFRFLKD